MGAFRWRQLVIDAAAIVFGSVITALGLSIFLIPNRLAAGGISGAAIVIHHLSAVRVGTLIFLLNIPLFLLSMRLLGITFGFKTLAGVVFLSAAVDVLTPVVPVLTREPLLAAIYGGVITGLGMGLVFRSGATTGGTDIIARIINNFTGINIGQALFMVDFVVILSAGFIFGAEIALNAMVAMFIAGKFIDLVQQGFSTAKAVLVISDHPQPIREKIINELDRGATLLRGEGGYSRHERDIILVVVSRAEVSRVKRLVKENDPRAFVIISDVHEVLGEGFRRIR